MESRRARDTNIRCAFSTAINYLPLFNATFDPLTIPWGSSAIIPSYAFTERDAAVPLTWFTVKGEAAYFTSSTPDTDEFALYVIQLERQVKEWSFVGGYAGEVVTRPGNPLAIRAGSGLCTILRRAGRADHRPNRSLAVETAVRAGGSFTRFEYSQRYGQHWRATAGWRGFAAI